MRFSNNSKPEFTDQKILTIYLFVMHVEERFKISQIHGFANGYLRSWFPHLPSYTTFITRLNFLNGALKGLAIHLIEGFQPLDCDKENSLLDSMPIITFLGKYTGKVAKEITDKGFYPTKGMYYYGIKLHALGYRRTHELPFPEQFLLTPASENDLNLFRQAWGRIENRTF